MTPRLTAFFAILALAGQASGARAQALADVARKEEERRKSIKATGKTYTNKDLPEATRAAAPAPAAPSVSQPDAKPQEEKESVKPALEHRPGDKSAAKDQSYWAGRMKTLASDLDRDQVLADALQSRINALTTDFVNRDDPAQRSVLATEREKAIAELDRLKKAVVEDRKAIADLEEEARRAGVPAGWLR
jgi:hypothetical protein